MNQDDDAASISRRTGLARNACKEGSAKPAVSVMMVCFNSAPTLTWAFGSLLAQTLSDWECIFVDDGSTDGSYEFAVGVGDPRIRAFRLDRNRGRGAARQFALEQARGEYLCILDADDWMFPWRFQTQVDFLEAEPKVAVVSAGMVILDSAGDLTGSRGSSDCGEPRMFPPMTRLEMPPFSFPASMIRMSIAKLCKFDPQLPTVEDIDFLMQIILNHEYGILNRNVYVYAEHHAVSLEKILEAYHFSSLTFHKYHATFPFQSKVNRLKVFVKSLVYRGAFALNSSEWMIRRRSGPATPTEIEEFQLARRIVAIAVETAFGPSQA